MAVEMPKEPAYYYECSYGDFRLVYHIPFSTVEKLVAKGAILEKVLQDFPDGIDINCFDAEYNAFKTTYNYKPSADPEKMRRAFLALFYSLDLGADWKKFRGSGYVEASKLEAMSRRVEKNLKARKVKLAEDIPLPKKHDLKDRRRVIVKRTAQQAIVDNALEDISKEITKEEKAARGARLTRRSIMPKMRNGESPGEVFSRAQMRHKD